MSIPFTDADITNMVEAQSIHAYIDTAVYIPTLTGADSYGQPTTSGTEVTIACAVVDGGKVENWKDFADIENLDAEIFFTDTTPTKGGKFRVTKRFGVAVTNKTYEIIGIQDRGAFGYVCALKAVKI